jgi:acetyltransferase-like isoleucine patch superfamily enzyme
MIVLWHFLVHGLDIKYINTLTFDWSNKEIPILLTSLLCFPVNCFIFISGYYSIKLRKNKVINFVVQLIFYALFVLALGFYFFNVPISFRAVLNALVPISSDRWWFFTSYFFIMLLSPIINTGLALINKGYAPIIIGENNWFAMRCVILKGTQTPNNCVIAGNSLLNKDYSSLSENIMLGGSPAKLKMGDVRRDICDDK